MAISIQLTPDTEHRLDSDAGMSVEHLLTHFDRIADAADAVPRLRRFILDLAVRGKLVSQDPNDEPASELLKRIAAEKARLVKAGDLKKQKNGGPFEEVEPPFDLPRGWLPARLDAIAVCLDYMRIPINATERKRRVAGKPQSQLFPYYGATQQQGWIDEYIFDEDLVLLGEDGVPFLDALRPKAYLITGKSWVNNHAHVFRGIFVSQAYLVHCLNVFDYSGRVVGATRAKLNQAKALDIPIMLPPLAEQHRIVAKVDELMALCDRLEAARAEREATRNRLTAASLARLNAPDPDPASFRKDAAFALDNLTPLTTRPGQINVLRQAILNLAVRGKLVPQDPNDEPASELLKKIATEKARRGKMKNHPARKPLPSLVLSSGLKLPSGWQLVRLGNVIQLWNGFAFRSEDYQTHGVPIVRIGDLRGGEVTLSNAVHVSEQVAKSVGQEVWVPTNALLIAMSGATTGKVAFNKTGQHLLLNQRVGRIESFFSDLNFVKYFFDTIVAKNLEISFGTAIPNLSARQINETVIALPPLAEQHRIVAKVDELMSLCDCLEASLSASGETRRRLLESLLCEVLEFSADGEQRDG